jgi:hypothetical protein
MIYYVLLPVLPSHLLANWVCLETKKQKYNEQDFFSHICSTHSFKNQTGPADLTSSTVNRGENCSGLTSKLKKNLKAGSSTAKTGNWDQFGPFFPF